MTNYFKAFLEEMKKLSGPLDKMTFTGGALNVDTEGGLPSDIYGDALVLPDVLPDQELLKGVTIKADEDNTDPVMVNGFLLGPGESVPIEIGNLNEVVVVGTATDVIYYLGS